LLIENLIGSSVLDTLRAIKAHLQTAPKNVWDEWLGRGYGRKPYTNIDSRIAPLVKVMNDTGVITTYASCQGHALSWRAPYIAFIAHVDCVAKIELALRQYQVNEQSSLNNHWTIHGSFDVHGNLVFKLWPPWLCQSTSTLLDWFKVGIFRNGLDKDFEKIGHLISDLFSSECQVIAASSRLTECR
jgi:hypothetical protein